MDSRIEDFLRVLRQGASVFAYSAQVKFPNAFKKNKAPNCKHGGIITIQAWELKILYFIAEDQTSLVQTNQKAYSAQTGDE
jgi:hypothetical protein